MTTPTPLDVDAVPCRRDPERMFPNGHGSLRAAQEADAKAVCDSGNGGLPCHLKDRCLAYAIRHDVAGVWGGSTEDERDQFRENNGIEPLSLATQSVRHLVYRRAS